ncbi:serine phosphatase RsbU (regulator of sigma subunit)/PAS domain-containing protein/anti-sigma regulatory factor (Ser/Thr protein kinase) [Kitasatospora sp. MAA19]|uniref:SpoIIE family protein phosphatase n=1 Tax=Kitasatospora sp. NPDC087861 TaxID=3364070 RepID=UPI00247ED984|nr:serine phosphatase RsbU (regulator of sigma subunit)/PAS domain-containing protein/anti-sigma regulatory factor (Ser/Thr protein kinase) [Kitasatospora sp. MAA19]
MFLLQVLVVLLLVVVAVTALLLKSRSDRLQAARDRSIAAAAAFAHGPGLVAVLQGPDPSATLQPLTEAARKQGKVDFIVVTNREGIRYTNPVPEQIGGKIIGTIGPALAGHVVLESAGGVLGEAVQAIVPVTDANGTVVGLVAAGVTVSHVGSAVGRQLPFVGGAGLVALGLATAGAALVSRRLRRQTHGLGPAEMTQLYEHHEAVLHAVREGVVIVDGAGDIMLVNDEARRLLDLPPGAVGRAATDLGLEPRMAELLASGRVATDEVIRVGDRLLVVNNRLTDRAGGPPGSVATVRDSTELQALAGRAEVARGRLRLLYDASVAVGTTLDVRRTAEELAQVAVPRFADYVTVDLSEPVLSGDEPAAAVGGEAVELRRVALTGIHDDHPLYRSGELVAFAASSPQATGFVSGTPVLVPDLRADVAWRSQDAERVRAVLNLGVHSLIAVPLSARGVTMGVADFWRGQGSEPFEEDDLSLAGELAARAAVCIDNARRYTREHGLAVALQRSLLPRGVPEQNALDIAYRYLPAEGGVGGDWFDVIPLSGTRVALVVGDVVGHGLHAAATMGRLRTAVQNFSTLDLPPDELLGHLDELVALIDQEAAASAGEPTVTGATCLYAVYDPTAGTCSVARAGHPLPVVVLPDGTTEFPDLPAGPPLGLGGLPFEATELHLPEGSSLVLYTDGLLEDRTRDIGAGLDILGTTLAVPARTPQETCEAVLGALLPTRQSDDIALLIARTRILEPGRINEWEVPADPSAVAGAREATTRQLMQWGLEEAMFTTELILSELITNAIRYGGEPIRVRLIHDRTLICEVSDTSSTSPHLRYAADEDEGGRGLFLVAQLAERWGTRYTPTGKIIWAEQILLGL